MKGKPPRKTTDRFEVYQINTDPEKVETTLGERSWQGHRKRVLKENGLWEKYGKDENE